MLEEILGLIVHKYEGAYGRERAGFPHEIGLLLGYRQRIMTGFIENNGKNFLYIGYWKVYSGSYWSAAYI